jgi:hypothetical protein
MNCRSMEERCLESRQLCRRVSKLSNDCLCRFFFNAGLVIFLKINTHTLKAKLGISDHHKKNPGKVFYYTYIFYWMEFYWVSYGAK